MGEKITPFPAASWQACVTTIKCDAIDEHVSVLIKGDWTSTCTWYKEFKASGESPRRGKLDHETRKKIALCQGPQCDRVTQYRDQLIREERRGDVSPEKGSIDPLAAP